MRSLTMLAISAIWTTVITAAVGLVGAPAAPQAAAVSGGEAMLRLELDLGGDVAVTLVRPRPTDLEPCYELRVAAGHEQTGYVIPIPAGLVEQCRTTGLRLQLVGRDHVELALPASAFHDATTVFCRPSGIDSAP